MTKRLLSSKLMRNAAWMLGGQGVGLRVQAAYFILMARSLGVREYGAFIGIVSLVALLAPFASLGTGNLLIRDTSRDRRCFPAAWGNALLVTLGGGSLLTMAVLLVGRILLPNAVALSTILCVAVADMLLGRIVEVGGQAFQAFEILGRTAQLLLMLNLARLLGAAAMMVFCPHPTASHWGYLYLVSSALPALYCIAAVTTKLGRPRLQVTMARADLIQGLYFSISLSAQNSYNNIDKTMLVRLASLDASGIYAAAYRLVDVAFIPVRSVLYAAYPSFFQQGAHGLEAAAAYARKLLSRVGFYGVMASLALFVLAPVAPVFLGKQYVDTIHALRWLWPLPFLKTLHYFAADALTGAGYQGWRSLLQLLVAGVNVSLNLWLIPSWSWQGAALASLASDSLLAISLWGAVYTLASNPAVPCGDQAC